MSIGTGKTATIVGAGLAGSLLACYLAKLGFQVLVYERRADPRQAGYVGGRSINLALSARGLWALAGVGLDQEVLRRAIPMKGRMIHAVGGGELAFHPYSDRPGEAINSISRGGLNLALIEAAARNENVSFLFEHRCVDVDLESCAAVFETGSGETVRVESDVVIGGDGAFSPVRGRLQRTDRFEYSQTYLAHGYKELHIPAVEGGKFDGFALDPNALHIWPRKSAMMIALPNPDKTFTCTLFWPFEGEHGFANLRSGSDVLAFFKREYADVPGLMPTLVEDFLGNPVSSLVTVRCWPWVQAAGKDKAVVLVGDAAHAIVPFFGQGMNAAFEDVRVLSECLEKFGESRGMLGALEEYQKVRKPNADAIARMALENFVEMRDKVGTRAFVWRKKLEHLLHELMPEWFLPRYNLVSFTTVPYVDAQRRGTRIGRVIRVLVLLAALVVGGIVGAFVPGLVVVLALVLGWAVWDRWEVEKETSV